MSIRSPLPVSFSNPAFSGQGQAPRFGSHVTPPDSWETPAKQAPTGWKLGDHWRGLIARGRQSNRLRPIIDLLSPTAELDFNQVEIGKNFVLGAHGYPQDLKAAEEYFDQAVRGFSGIYAHDIASFLTTLYKQADPETPIAEAYRKLAVKYQEMAANHRSFYKAYRETDYSKIHGARILLTDLNEPEKAKFLYNRASRENGGSQSLEAAKVFATTYQDPELAREHLELAIKDDYDLAQCGKILENGLGSLNADPMQAIQVYETYLLNGEKLNSNGAQEVAGSLVRLYQDQAEEYLAKNPIITDEKLAERIILLKGVAEGTPPDAETEQTIRTYLMISNLNRFVG